MVTRKYKSIIVIMIKTITIKLLLIVTYKINI